MRHPRHPPPGSDSVWWKIWNLIASAWIQKIAGMALLVLPVVPGRWRGPTYISISDLPSSETPSTLTPLDIKALQLSRQVLYVWLG